MAWAYRVWGNFAIFHSVIGDKPLTPRGVDASIDDGVCYVDTLGAELASQGLAQGAKSKLARSERSKQGRTLDGRRGACDDQGRRVR